MSDRLSGVRSILIDLEWLFAIIITQLISHTDFKRRFIHLINKIFWKQFAKWNENLENFKRRYKVDWNSFLLIFFFFITQSIWIRMDVKRKMMNDSHVGLNGIGRVFDVVVDNQNTCLRIYWQRIHFSCIVSGIVLFTTKKLLVFIFSCILGGVQCYAINFFIVSKWILRCVSHKNCTNEIYINYFNFTRSHRNNVYIDLQKSNSVNLAKIIIACSLGHLYCTVQVYIRVFWHVLFSCIHF